jgi:hypothetical protein
MRWNVPMVVAILIRIDYGHRSGISCSSYSIRNFGFECTSFKHDGNGLRCDFESSRGCLRRSHYAPGARRDEIIH